MAKFIDSDKLQAQIERKSGKVGSNMRWTEGYNDAINRIKSMVHSAPAADVQEVRHGKWIWDKNARDWNLGAYVCSECECVNNNLPDNRYNPYMFIGSKYCPNCGARMDGDNDEQ